MLKWVGAVTAVLSLVFGVQKLAQVISEGNAADRRITELRDVGLMQQKAGDYAAAWDSFDAALMTAESGGMLAKLLGRVDARTQELRAAREDLAMEWLRNIRLPQGQTFSEVTGNLLPALDHGAVTAAAARKADLLAHIGWAYFLRSRDGASGLNPQQQYETALRVDAENAYAHAYLAHWLAWNRRDAEQVKQHFDAALAAARDRSFVRTMQLAAFRNQGSAGEREYVAIVGDMLKNNEEVSDDARRAALAVIVRSCSRPESSELAALKATLPSNELATTYESLLALESQPQPSGNAPTERDACRAVLAR
ncbi:MAG: hypothetical protein ACREV5_02200 [Steroidobacter sp.]